MIRVLIVDDHPVVHEGVAAALERTHDIRVVRAVDSIAAALRVVKDTKPDVVLLDVRLSRSSSSGSSGRRRPEAASDDGLTGIAALAGEWPSARVLMFSAYDADAYVLGALRAGARGYALKGAPASDLVTAIRRVHAGDSYVSPSLSSKIIEQMQTRSGGSRLLTPRELMVLQLMGAGLPNREIAVSLEITERTVKFHVTAILNKLGADNRTQVVTMATRRGILADVP